MKKTMKVLALSMLLALFLPLTNLNAQLFDEGDLVFSAGIGLGSTYYTYGSYYHTVVPPLFLSGDYCLREDLGPGNLGVGGFLGFSSYKYHYDVSGYDYGWKYNTMIISARGTYHFTELVDKLDIYGGVLIGAKIVTNEEFGDYTGSDYTVNKSGPVFDIFAGVRYQLTDNFGVMSELGYGIAWFKIGIALKF
jgi:hypothetical protein